MTFISCKAVAADADRSARAHFVISLFKSGFRFVACAGLFAGSLPLAAVFFGLAEVLGVAEEMVL